MKLFAALKSIRELQRDQIPFVKSILDFDIIIEIGFAEEEGQPLTLKQLFLLNIGSRTTVRRRLVRLSDAGVVIRRKKKNDQRSTILAVAPVSRKHLTQYGSQLAGIWHQTGLADLGG